ncbi:asparagine synthase [Niveomyces insectorum RCEF 264]|uniref:Asparagine synthase n=1 Tax=Niveomyces insectorum RCEF 264 TaxID=1081102 RepID=A0A167RZV8_9HYPO|nr:asparagine synthase [Niveomyces insectorum RCEF 264]
MCGIHAVISVVAKDTRVDADYSANPSDDGLRRYRSRLCRRGPDHLGRVVAERDGPAGQRLRLELTATVLSLRGSGVTEQPFADAASGALLCWNGEAWKLGGTPVAGNDGEAVFARLTRASVQQRDDHDRCEGKNAAVLAVLRSIEGPFALIYYDRPAGCVYFGRDRLGRRSLLLQRSGGNSSSSGKARQLLALSSVAGPADDGAQWAEVDADGIYMMDLAQPVVVAPDGLLSTTGGITRFSWADDGVDDASVVLGIGPFNTSTEPSPEAGGVLCAESPSVQQLLDELAASLRLRVLHVPRPPPLDNAATGTTDTRIAVLFSGGLDCTVLARMSHDLLPPAQGMDLINVAFENPRVAAHLGASVTDVYEACPDRVTGRKSFAELQRVCPDRAWRFLAVNVPYAETVAHRPEILSLMHPHNTEMDLSIASALYFAARGVGVASATTAADGPPTPTACVTTPARVLLSGLGADELFGGYGRHGVAFARQGYAGLAAELLLDVARLGARNLGRDDRVMAHWGKEVRFPYLDEAVVRWAMAQPAWAKCDFAQPEGGEDDGVEPAKRVLRLAALSLGLDGVAREKKRAIQFGARTAKMESGRVKGTAVVS